MRLSSFAPRGGEDQCAALAVYTAVEGSVCCWGDIGGFGQDVYSRGVKASSQGGSPREQTAGRRIGGARPRGGQVL